MFNRYKTWLQLVSISLTISLAITSCNRHQYPIISNVVSDQEMMEQEPKPEVQVLDESDEIAKVDSLMADYEDVVEEEIEDYYSFAPFTDSESKNVRLPEYKNMDVNDLQIILKDADSTEFHYPTDTKLGFVTSPYGWRHGRMHSGIDLKVNQGDNIYAAFDGVVRLVQYQRYGWGYHLVIRHYNGLETLYSHSSKILVKVNQKVKAGDLIALGGRTGRATGTHLHFEVRVAGETINPALILDTDNKTHKDENLYITKRSGKIYASNDDDKAMREAEIISTLSVKYYVVRSGDYLGRIASRNGTTVSKLCNLNNISSKSKLRVGQRLVVRDGLTPEQIKQKMEESNQGLTRSTTAADMYGSSFIVRTGSDAAEAREQVKKAEELKEAQLLAEQKAAREKEEAEKEAIRNGTLPQKNYYTVRKGDMLSTIASRNHTTVSQLCSLNNITTRTKLQIGQKLLVSTTLGGKEVAAQHPSAYSGSTTTYVVKSGDVLSSIAERNHTSVSTICNLNNITTRSTLRIGQKLLIPGVEGGTQSTETPVIYTVKSGDILATIAKRNGTTIDDICALNGISRTSTLKIGQKLKLSSTSSAVASNNESTRTYTVKSGDMLSSIAARNNTTVSKICALNNITTRTTLRIGQKLKL